MILRSDCPVLLPKVPLTTWQMGELRGKTYRWLREGGMVDSWWDSSSRRRRRNIRHEKEKESERERDTAAFALFIADIYWLGNLKKKKEGVCVLSDSERVLDTEKCLCWNVRDALWLATLSSQGHWRRRGLAPFLVKLFYQGCVGCISTSSPSLHRASRLTEDDGSHYHELLILN